MTTASTAPDPTAPAVPDQEAPTVTEAEAPTAPDPDVPAGPDQAEPVAPEPEPAPDAATITDAEPEAGTPAEPSFPAPGAARILGARVDNGGVSFALWAPRASRVELVLVAEDRSQSNRDLVRADDGVWSGHVPGVGAGQLYGYRVHGEWAPEQGARFNPARLLLDPYARAITGGVDYLGPILDHSGGSTDVPDRTDSFRAVPLSVVVGDTPPPEPLAEPVPAERTVIYELHVAGYTRLHPLVPEHLRGTFAGLGYPAVTDHLRSLGVTSVELLPAQHFVSEPFLVGRGLTNYWGYNTLGFFAPHAAYGSIGTRGEQVTEFKEMVTALHRAGIEVILDVVYNHTGEGGHTGPTLSFRGIDHRGYYRLTDDQRNDYDVTGCGNSVDTSNPGVLRLVLDSLRYWVAEMGVDGFRFDLATTLLRDHRHHVDHDHPLLQAIADDPVLAKTKIIAEPWDVGPYGYQVGAFGPGWSEWNDAFRNTVRDFWRGHTHGVREIATRLAGSQDLFGQDGRDATASVNFITAHDGFTLRDLVSYNGKHNEANGEHNADGADDNRSWNCGHEGETDDPGVNALRHRQARNLMATLLLAAGTPMITAGDELGRTQQGNNNAYCQDSPLSWVHWDTEAEWSDVRDLTRTLLALRADSPIFGRKDFRRSEPILDARSQPTGRKNLAWFGGGPHELSDAEWNDGARRTLGMYLADDTPDRDHDEAYLIWFHAGADPVEVELPGGPWAKGYTVIAHSGTEGELPDELIDAGHRVTLPGRIVVLMRAE